MEYAVGVQVHDDGTGPQAILVVIVLPNLTDRYFCHFGDMGVGNVDRIGNAVILRGVTIHRFFPNSVDNGNTIAVHRQIHPQGDPLILRTQVTDLAGVLTVGQQVDFHRVRTQAILVIGIIPLLVDGDDGGLRLVGVDDGEAIVAVGIAGGHIQLLQGVNNGAAVAVNSNAGKHCLPAIGRIQFHAQTGVHTVGDQCNGYGVGTDAVLVVVVIPDFIDGNIHHFGDMGVSNHDLVGIDILDRAHIAFQAQVAVFFHRIHNGLAVGIHVQIGEGVAPAIGTAQNSSLAGVDTVGKQSNAELFGTDAVLVICIIPDLIDCDLGGFGLVGIDDLIDTGFAVQLVGNDVATDLGTLHGSIFDGAAVFHLVQISKDMVPVIALAQENGDAGGLTVGIQLHFHLCSQAVAVMVIVPYLQNAEGGLLRRIGVGDDHVAGVTGITHIGGRVVLHRCLVNRVVNGHAIGILGKIGPGVGPAVGGGQGYLQTGVIAVNQQMHNDGIGTDAVTVVIVIPNLGHGHLGSLGNMGVGNGQAIDGGGVALHGSLGNRVNDLITTVILGQASQRIGPAGGSGQLHGGHQSAVAVDIDGNGLGTDAVLVICVIPDLVDGDLGLIGRVGVGQGEAGGSVTGDGHRVASRRVHFPHGVDHSDAIGILIHIIKAAAPTVGCAQNQGLAGGRAVGKQFHGDRTGADAILVVVVIPILLDGNADLLNLVGVNDLIDAGQFVRLIADFIAVHLRQFHHGVRDLHAIGISIQVGEAELPAIARTQITLLAGRLVVGIQLHFHTDRTQAVLVVIVYPHLLHGDRSLFRCIGVGDDHMIVIGGIPHVFGSVAGNLFFVDRIVDLGSIVVFIQIAPLAAPAIGCGQSQGLASVVTIDQQMHDDGGRTLAVLVVLIIPYLADADLSLCHFVGIGDHEAIGRITGVAGRIAGRHTVLCHRVDDLHTVGILGQVLEGDHAQIGGIGFQCAVELAIGIQVHNDSVGTDAVLVVIVHPNLADGDGNGVGDMGVGGSGACVGNGVAVRHIHFPHGIGHQLAVVILSHAGKGTGPVAGGIDRDGLAGSRAVGDQFQNHGVGTDAVLVVVIHPNLVDSHIHGFGHMGVDDFIDTGLGIGLIADGIAAGNIHFLRRVNNAHTGGHQIQTSEGVLPVVALVQLCCQTGIRAVGQQFHDDGAGTDAVLVVVILPHLLHGEGSFAGLVGVGDDHVVGIAGIGIIGGSILCHGLLIYRVVDGHAIGIFVQLAPAVGPAVGGGQGHAVTCLHTVCQQMHDNGGGTLAVLVILIIPNLADGDMRLLSLVGIGDDKALLDGAGHNAGVAGDSRFFHGIDDLGAVFVLIQRRQRVGPVVGGGQLHGGHQSAVAVDIDGNGLGTYAILVICVIPDLVDGKARGIGHERVVDNIGCVMVAALGDLSLVLDDHAFGGRDGNLEGDRDGRPCGHIQDPGQLAVGIHAAIVRRTHDINGMGRDAVGDGDRNVLSGKVGVANGVNQGIPGGYILTIDADRGIIRFENVLFYNIFKGVVGYLVGGVGVHTVTDDGGVGHHDIGFIHLHLEGYGNTFSLSHMDDPVDTVTHKSTAVGGRAIHIRGMVRDGVADIRCHSLAGIVGIGDVVSQNFACVDLLAVDLGSGIACQIDFLLGDLLEGGIGKARRDGHRGGRLGGTAGIQILHFHRQLAIAQVADPHAELMHRAVVDHIGLGIYGSIFHDGIEEGAGLGEGEGLKCVATAYIHILIHQSSLCQIKGAVGLIELEGKDIVRQQRTGQSLGTVEGDGGSVGCVGVFKLNVGIGHIRSSAEHTIGVGDGYGDGDGVACAGIDHTGCAARHFTDGVSVGAGGGVGDGAEGEGAVSLIGNSLQQSLAFVELEAELAGCHSAAMQMLGAAEGISGGGCGVNIAESNRVGGGVLKVVGSLQLAGLAIVLHFHH